MIWPLKLLQYKQTWPWKINIYLEYNPHFILKLLSGKVLFFSKRQYRGILILMSRELNEIFLLNGKYHKGITKSAYLASIIITVVLGINISHGWIEAKIEVSCMWWIVEVLVEVLEGYCSVITLIKAHVKQITGFVHLKLYKIAWVFFGL